MPFKKITIIAAASAVGIVSTAFAAGHLTPEQQRGLDARQAHMSLYAFNLGPLGGMAQEQIPYDAEVASAAAANLAALAAIDESAYWVEGTDTSIEGTRAKPEIWADMAGFEAEQVKLVAATATLASVAGDGLDAMKAAFGPVGQSCGSCHESYRAPRQ
ncbi:MAG: cytochrome c [Yoonia sp.]|uniref:c-type cytochrome n=1 Tax=Yoonia sp. TaxID=2212373 RepID=UPI00273EED4E|nr:cytochrome c [Yoonia sp.]MDP5085016.1 cytochrome c [Yoonia sp.]